MVKNHDTATIEELLKQLEWTQAAGAKALDRGDMAEAERMGAEARAIKKEIRAAKRAGDNGPVTAPGM